METPKSTIDQGLWFYALPLLSTCPSSSSLTSSPASVCLLAAFLLLALLAAVIVKWAAPAGPAWPSSNTIPGPRGFPVLGSLLEMGPLAHRRLAELAAQHNAASLMALSLGSTRLVVATTPASARQILTCPSFANRPLNDSARLLHFHRAIGFAPYGPHWRSLRRIAAAHLFSPRALAAHEKHRQLEADALLEAIAALHRQHHGAGVTLRPLLEQAALNHLMSSVFGKRYDLLGCNQEAQELQAMVREGFELLGAFNASDHLQQLRALDPQRVRQRCEALMPRVTSFVSKILDEHRQVHACALAEATSETRNGADGSRRSDEGSDHEDQHGQAFAHVLLSMQGREKLEDEDIIAVLWEMIFRGTDSVAVLLEWALAEVVLRPDVQEKMAEEVEAVAGEREVRDADMGRLPYVQAVVQETLRLHPPGPLLSWARLAAEDVEVAGHVVPAGTTAMVNMWAIMRDGTNWAEPGRFKPERFDSRQEEREELRLAPFGAGRRMCPGRALGLATAHLWLARLVQRFRWAPDPRHPVDLSDHLSLSCHMATPLVACPLERGSRPH